MFFICFQCYSLVDVVISGGSVDLGCRYTHNIRKLFLHLKPHALDHHCAARDHFLRKLSHTMQHNAQYNMKYIYIRMYLHAETQKKYFIQYKNNDGQFAVYTIEFSKNHPQFMIFPSGLLAGREDSVRSRSLAPRQCQVCRPSEGPRFQ